MACVPGWARVSDKRIAAGYPYASFRDVLLGMTKRLVDVDDTKLDEVRTLLGTSTTKATVNGALEEVLALAARRRALLDGAVAGSPDLAQDEHRRAAWA
jgi:Arc/MetJ family transcription regulator